MKGQRRILLLFMSVLLVVAGIGINVMLPKIIGEKPAPVVITQQVETGPIVVATIAIKAQTKLDATNLAITQFPIELIPPKSVKKIDDLVGQFAAIDIPAGLPVTKEQTIQNADDYVVPTTKPIQIPPGDVGIPIKYDATTMGYVIEGGVVDLIGFDNQNHLTYLMQNVLVGRIGNPGEGVLPSATKVPTVVILYVTRQQGLELELLEGSVTGARITGLVLVPQPKTTTP